MPESSGLDRFVKLPMLPDLGQVGKSRLRPGRYLQFDRLMPEDVMKRLEELEELYGENIEKILKYMEQLQFSVSAAFDETIRGINERTKEVSFSFFLDNVGANLTNQALSNGMDTRGHAAVEAGSIVGIVGTINEARTGGTLTVEPLIVSGADASVTATGLTAIIDGTNTRTNFTTQGPGEDTFVAGDLIGCRVTTVGFAPTTADLDASVAVIYSGRSR